MSIPSIGASLKQMEALAQQASGHVAKSPVDESQGAKSFAGALKTSLEKVNAMHTEAGSQAKLFQAGTPGIELHDVMLDNQKASLAFEMSVKVRNKMVMAYQDIMKMPV